MEIKSFTLVDESKIDRALNGTPNAIGGNLGGIGDGAYREGTEWKREGTVLSEEAVDKLESALLAEYDKLGGFIRRGDDKVRTGSFYDFKAKKPHAKPVVSFEFRVKGKVVVVPDGEALPGAVRAEKIAKGEEDAAKPSDSGDVEAAPEKKSKKSKKPSDE